MTTPTREQVLDWGLQATEQEWFGTHEWRMVLCTLARADLEATVKKQAAEIERLSERRCEICGYAEHHREHTGCLRQQLAASQAKDRSR